MAKPVHIPPSISALPRPDAQRRLAAHRPEAPPQRRIERSPNTQQVRRPTLAHRSS